MLLCGVQVLGGSLAAVFAAWFALWQVRPVEPAVPAPLTLEVSAATRLLVLAPHPDDEALGAAGLIARVAKVGGAVHVVLLTSGDGFPEAVEAIEGVKNPKPSDYRSFGVLRERETRTAMTLLGVRPGAISFLGFPDGGLCVIASRYLFDKRRAFESPYTDRTSPPPTEQIVRGARYRGIDVRRELEDIIADYNPTLIVLPHSEDEHPDHCSTQIFAREALNEMRRRRSNNPRVLHYLIHYGQWPLDSESRSTTAVLPPSAFPAADGQWAMLSLTPAETDLKRRAILSYSSQTQVIGRFMQAFARDTELYIEGEPASPPECWCDGQNVATEVSPGRYRRKP